ncbi:MAG: DNA polymerase III subunit delta' [Desulfobacterales bacterium]|nr:DNA polymerase III subunit delta' [Desulfobacterales bacterium]MDX2512530.1 DNA polymerase III subunit delta' [Desulfobacterales bacterium]
MPGFESIVDQEKPVRLLSRIIRKGKIPHALLFTGIEGLGKKEAANVFAMACNCLATEFSNQPVSGKGIDHKAEDGPASPCGRCKSCKKIISGNHPDVISIEPDRAHIRIGQIRDLCQMLAMKPYEARHRVVIISDAHALNPEAGNSLLKVLEEPPDRTVLVLTAHHLHDLLPTIASRCQHIRFNPISHEVLTDFLVAKEGISAREADLLATLAKGSLTRALSLVATGWFEQRAWILRVMEKGPSSQPPLDRVTTLLAFSEKLAQKKDRVESTLEVLRIWFRDLMIYQLSPDMVVNKDLSHTLKRISEETAMDDLLSAYDAVQSAQEKINGNANPRLTLDVMMMKLTEFDHEKSCRHPI